MGCGASAATVTTVDGGDSMVRECARERERDACDARDVSAPRQDAGDSRGETTATRVGRARGVVVACERAIARVGVG